MAKELKDAPPLSLDMGKQDTGLFGPLALAWQAAMIPLFFVAQWDTESFATIDSSSVYNFYVGVALMMFVGFGYLMSFLKVYGLGAVGFTMFITCAGMQWALLVEHIFNHGLDIKFNMVAMIDSAIAVACVLISFGALIGKVNPLQVTVLVILEIVFYALNKIFICIKLLEIMDVGGTIIVHVFGAYFGIGACLTLGAAGNEKFNGASYNSDLFSLIGTVFLWLFWPSFVAGLLPAGSDEHGFALLNSIMALLGSTVTTFGLLTFLNGKRLSTVPIQNATLAGGVSIGALANFNMRPGGAVLVGCAAGAISCVGFVKPLIPSKYDTCGINNLHGMPGILGGLISVVLPLFMDTGSKPGMQILGLVITVAAALITGAGTGFILKMIGSPKAAFNDESVWDCEIEAESESHTI